MNKVRVIAFLLAIVMVVSLLASCQSAEEGSQTDSAATESATTEVDESGVELKGNIYVTGLPIAKEPVTYEIMYEKDNVDKSASQNDKEIMQISTEGTNISIEWREVTTIQFEEQLNLMLATGDNMPDAILRPLSEQQIAENPEDFMVLTEEIMQQWTPNIYSQIEANIPGGVDFLKKTDGNLYSLPTGPWTEYANWATDILYIREDWVNDLGMEMPETIDDLYNILVGFKENDMNGNGDPDDEVPYLFAQANWASKIQALAGSWGMAGRTIGDGAWYGRVEDGQYTLSINEQRFRDFLTEMNKWYNAGLINADGFTMSNDEYITQYSQHDWFGLRSAWTPIDEYEGRWNAVPVLTAEGYEGQEVKAGELNTIVANRNGFTISATCEEPEGLLRWWDHIHSDPEWKRISRDGPQGDYWDYAEDGTPVVTIPEVMPDNINNTSEYHYTFAWRSDSALMFIDEIAKPNMDEMSPDAIRYTVGPMYEEYFPAELVPDVPIPAEMAEEFSYVETEIKNEVNNFIGTSIINGITDDTWDAYVQRIEDLGAEQWVAHYQAIIDGDF